MDLPRNRFKRALAQGKAQIGVWCTIPDPSVAEALAGAGFDWMVIDTEHTPVEPSQVLPLLQAAAPYTTDCIVRPHLNDVGLIKRHLDQGALTLLLPFVQTPAEAAEAVRSIRYAPDGGIRGVAGTMRASRYGRVKDYVRRAADELCLIVQVETVEALSRVEDIAAVDGVDALFIGPSDLASTMGHLGNPGHPDVKDAVLSGIRRIKQTGTAAGLLTLDPDFADKAIGEGADFVAVALDMAVLVKGVDALADRFGRKPA